MNNEQQTWILKHNLNPETMRPILLKNGWEEEYIEHFFEELFQPLDVSGLTRQVEELIQTHDYVQAANQPMESNWDLEVTSFAEQIVLLLLNQEGETK